MARGRSANLSVDVVANTRDAEHGMDRFGSKVAGVMAGVTASVTTFAIDRLAQAATWAGDQLVDSVHNAADLQAILGTTQVMFKGATDKVVKWSKEAAKGIGMSQLAYLEATRDLQVWTKQLGLTEDANADLNNSIINMAADIGAFTDVGTVQAIDAITMAFRGQDEGMDRLGIAYSEAAVKAAYFRATGEEASATLTAEERVIGTTQLVTEKAAEASGAYAREQEGLAAQTAEANAQWENMKTQVGDALLPIVLAMAKALNEDVIPALQSLKKWMDENGVTQAIKDAAYWIKDHFLQALKDFQEWWDREGEETIHTLQQNVRDLKDDFQKLWDKLVLVKDELDKLFANMGGFGHFLATYMRVSIAGTRIEMELLAGAIGFVLDCVALFLAQANWWVDKLRTVWNWFGNVKDRVNDLADAITDLVNLKGIGDFFSKLNPANWPVIGGMAAPAAFGAAAFAGGASGRAGGGLTYAPTFHVTATVPPGVYAGDVGAAIVDALREWEGRNGPVPLSVAGSAGSARVADRLTRPGRN